GHLGALGATKRRQHFVADVFQTVRGEGLRQGRGHDLPGPVHGEAARGQMDKPGFFRLEEAIQEAHLVRMFRMVSRNWSAPRPGGKPTHNSVSPHGATAILRCGPEPINCWSWPTCSR